MNMDLYLSLTIFLLSFCFDQTFALGNQNQSMYCMQDILNVQSNSLHQQLETESTQTRKGKKASSSL